MAMNVGFAQITVTPTFTGMQKAIQNEVKSTFPSAGTTAANSMGTSFASAAGSKTGTFSRAITNTTGGLSKALGVAGATGAAGFVSKAGSAISAGASKVTSAIGSLGIPKAFAAQAATAGALFQTGFIRAIGPLAAIFGVGAVVKGGANRLMDIENAEASLKGLGYMADEIQSIMDNALESVKGTPYALNDAVKVAQGLVASGIAPGDDLTTELKRVADAATIAQIPLGDMGQIWNKITASGRIQGEELAQLGDRGIPILQMLSEHLGVSVDDVRKLASEGKISADVFSEAMDKKVGGAALEAGNTTQGAFANMRAAASRLGVSILENLGWSGEGNVSKLNGITTFIDETLIPTFERAVQWVKDNSDWLLPIAKGIAAVAAAFTLWSLSVGAVRIALDLLAKNKIIVILGLITAAVIYLWENNETFRTIVTEVWEKVQEAISTAWAWIEPKLQAFKEWITDTLVPALKSFWEDTVKPVWENIYGAIESAWNNFIKPAFEAIWDFITNTLVPLFVGFYENVIKPVWEGIKFAIEVAWNAIKLVFDAIVWAIENVLGPIFKWFYDSVISPVWDWIKDKIDKGWKFIKPIFEALGNFVKDTVAPAFKTAVETIGGYWESLKEILAKPVNWVIDTVWNNGIVTLFEKVAKAIGSSARLPKLSTIGTGTTSTAAAGTGPMRAFKKGGLAPKGWALVGEEGPELVNFTQPGRVYTAAQTRAVIKASQGKDVTAQEGRAAAGSRPEDALLPMGGILDNISRAVGGVVSWVRGGLANLIEIGLKPLRAGLNTIAPRNGGTSELLNATITKVFDEFTRWVRGEDAKAIAEGLGEYTGARSGWVRPSRGAITSYFGSRWGGFHNGMDFGGNLPVYAAANGLVKRTGNRVGYGNTGLGVLLSHGGGLESYYGHADPGEIRVRAGQTVKAGQWISMGGNTGNSTGQHLHFSIFKNGKALNPLSFIGSGAPRNAYDSGGWLQPGVSRVANYTGKPEPVLTNGQWRDIHSLAMRGASGDTYEISMVVDAKDLDGLRSIEEFAAGLRRRTRQGVTS